MEQIDREIQRLKKEYPIDLSKNKIKDALSKMYTICGVSVEMLHKPDETVQNELKTWQDKYNELNADKLGKIRAKKQKELDKIIAEHEQAIAKDEFEKAEKFSLKRCHLLKEMGQYYASLLARGIQMEYRNKKFGGRFLGLI